MSGSASITSISPVIAWAWDLRDLGPQGYDTGARCIYCARDVAAPARRRAVCLYCALDRGLTPAEDAPIGERWPA
ncbi:hypothetical protein [Pikeienuella sp. HZG-20]|uniref:hypothetical protein n=1 Tax=Paludibacillus litoralis TaxID=3133267 RepID=UPI0030EDDAE1